MVVHFFPRIVDENLLGEVHDHEWNIIDADRQLRALRALYNDNISWNEKNRRNEIKATEHLLLEPLFERLQPFAQRIPFKIMENDDERDDSQIAFFTAEGAPIWDIEDTLNEDGRLELIVTTDVLERNEEAIGWLQASINAGWHVKYEGTASVVFTENRGRCFFFLWFQAESHIKSMTITAFELVDIGNGLLLMKLRPISTSMSTINQRFVFAVPYQ